MNNAFVFSALLLLSSAVDSSAKEMASTVTLETQTPSEMSQSEESRQKRTGSDGFEYFLVRSSDGQSKVEDLQGNTIVPWQPAQYGISYHSNQCFAVYKSDALYNYYGFAITYKTDAYYCRNGQLLADGSAYDLMHLSLQDDGRFYFLVYKNQQVAVMDDSGKIIVPFAKRASLFYMSSSDTFKYQLQKDGSFYDTNVPLTSAYKLRKYPEGSTEAVGSEALIALGSGASQAPVQSQTMAKSLVNSQSSGADVQKELHTEEDGFRWYETKQGNACGVESAEGRTIIPLSKGYYGVGYKTPCPYGYYRSDKPGVLFKYEYYTKEGKQILDDSKYDDVTLLGGKEGKPFWLNTKKDGKEGACDLNGKEIVPPLYAGVIYYEGHFEVKDNNGNWTAYSGSNTPRSYSSTNGSSYASSNTMSKADEMKAMFDLAYNTPDAEGQTKYDRYMAVIQADLGNIYGYKAPAFNNIGALFESLGDLDNAKTYFEYALQVNPAYDMAKNNLSRVKSQRRSQRWTAIGNALGAMGQAMGQMNGTYNSGSGYSGGGYSGGSSGSGSSSCSRCGGSGKCTSKSASADKYYCHGSGRCGYCHGSGVYQLYGQTGTCTGCNGNGRCHYCNGSGKCSSCGGR